jgi:two-component system phosphate regulon sensor histidine kinase PhoR
MLSSRRNILTQVLLLLGIGTFVGWLYGYPERGMLVAALVILGWQLRKLVSFSKALHTRNFDDFRIGDGIWEQLYSRFSHERSRSTKYKRRYQKLLKEVRKSTNAMPDGGIVLNVNFEIVSCNKAAQELVGFRSKQDRGQRVDNLLRDPGFIRYLTGRDFDSGIEIRSPVNEDSWLFCRLVPYGADQHLLLIRDITERYKLTTMRRDFVANASHELRSPLTVISGYLDSMSEDETFPAEWEKPIDQMRSQAHRMNSIVAELLELSRLEAAGPEVARRQVNIDALLVSAKKSYQGISGIPEIDVDVQSHAHLLGKSADIESVVSNLLSNAIRHTPEDGHITLSWSSDADGGRLSVTDNGDGIPEEARPRLTERFFRVDSGRARQDGGIGLGLAIVKHALLRHDAHLEIESELDKGSTFNCLFPTSRLAVEDPVSIQQSTN